jgi:hypothetical protein
VSRARSRSSGLTVTADTEVDLANLSSESQDVVFKMVVIVALFAHVFVVVQAVASIDLGTVTAVTFFGHARDG